ncbi:MAG TPA: helix-turn-helix domain-containing protein [Solirubrobacteraceae bacterium]|nr:helix-turn-helix domain-containing protein [Solirubrobacteraceae bacterium]
MSHVPPTKRHPYDQWAPDARALDLVGDKWTLLIARDLMSGPRRFVELQRVLPGISTEQLRSRLNRMVADGLLTRSRYREVPPRVDYALTDRGRELAPVLGELARWGWRWAWSEPRASERVDVGAIVRLLPGLTQAGAGGSGTVELAISDARDGGALVYLATLREQGPATIRELQTPGESCDARVSGSTDAWVSALGPDRKRSSLRISGDRALATALLELISPPR